MTGASRKRGKTCDGHQTRDAGALSGAAAVSANMHGTDGVV